MRRVLMIGAPGSGKSTLATRLAKHRPEIPKAIARYGTHLNVVRLTNDRDVAEFLRTAEAG